MNVVERALLNTLLGMGTVFLVLIFISCLIGCFSLISKSQKKAVKEKTETAAKTVEPAEAAPVIEEEDDPVLIAVIAAAIAASEGVSPEGLVVRSIRRSGKSWKNA